LALGACDIFTGCQGQCGQTEKREGEFVKHEFKPFLLDS
jgi:hypothetical protein